MNWMKHIINAGSDDPETSISYGSGCWRSSHDALKVSSVLTSFTPHVFYYCLLSYSGFCPLSLSSLFFSFTPIDQLRRKAAVL